MQKPYKENWLIIANSEPIEKDNIIALAENNSIMVLDGAFTSSLMEWMQPDIVLGDFDSIDEKIETYPQIKFIRDDNQDSTDLEKGLSYLATLNADCVTIVNATGWRLDHTLYNLGLLKRYHKMFKSLSIVTAIEKIYYLEDQSFILQAEQKQPLAVLAFPEAVVQSSGLQYNMSQLTLRLGFKESTSNFILGGAAYLSVSGGALLLVSHSTTVSQDA